MNAVPGRVAPEKAERRQRVSLHVYFGVLVIAVTLAIGIAMTAFFTFGAFFAFIFLGSLLMQQVLGYSPTRTGVCWPTRWRVRAGRCAIRRRAACESWSTTC